MRWQWDGKSDMRKTGRLQDPSDSLKSGRESRAPSDGLVSGRVCVCAPYAVLTCSTFCCWLLRLLLCGKHLHAQSRLKKKINHAAVVFQYIFLQCLLTITRIYFPLVWIFIWLQNKSLNRNHRSFIGTLHHKKTDHWKIISSFIRF